MDLISKQAAIDAIVDRCDAAKWGRTPKTEELVWALERLPSAQPEQKNGKWIELDSDEDRYDEIKCSRCRHMFTVDTYHWTDIGFTKSDLNFCPNCGADMKRGGQDD